MKKLSLLFTFILCSFFVNAQVGFKAETKLGFGFFQVDGDHFGGYNKLGANVGLGIYAPINENWDVGFELLYAQKGSKLKVDPEDPNARIFILQFDYVEIPLLAKKETDKFSFEFGASIGVNIKSEMDEGAGFKETSINKNEIAYLLGASYRFSEKVGIGLRHQQSLIRIGNNYPNGLNVFNRIGLYNRGFVLHYQYRL